MTELLSKLIFEQIVPLLKSKSAKYFSVGLSGSVVSAAIGFLTSIIVLRNLDVAAIGILYPLIGVMLIGNQLADLGISTTFIKLASAHFKTDPEASLEYFATTFRLKMKLAVAALIIICLGSGLISNFLFKQTEHWPYVCIIAIATVLTIFSTFCYASLQIENRFRLLALTRLLPNLFKFIALIIFYYTGHFTLNYVLAAFLLVPLCSSLLGLIFMRKDIIGRKYYTPKHNHEIFKYSKWVGLSSIVVSGIGQVDTFMVRSMSGSIELASLLGGLKLAGVLDIVSSNLATILLPKVSSMNGLAELKYYFKRSLLMIPFALILLVVGLPIAKFLIPLVLGEKYIPSIGVFQYYYSGFCIDICLLPLSLIIYKLNKDFILTYLNIFQLLLNVLGNYFLIPSMGANGAALTSVLIRVFAIVVVLVFLYREGFLKK